MNGTGTQAEPFVPNNWADFITAIGTAGAYVNLPIVLVRTTDAHIKHGKLYFDSQGNRIASPVESELLNYYENSFKLDGNSYAPLGLRLNFEGVTVDGNGASIVNIYVPNENYGVRFQGTYEHNLTTLRNINFLNIYSQSSDAWGAIGGNDGRLVETENVQFQGDIVTGSFFGQRGGYAYNSTTFSLIFNMNAKFTTRNLNNNENYYNFCHFDFYGNPNLLFSSGNGNKFLNCKMTGKITGTYGNIPLFPSDSSSAVNVIDMDTSECVNVEFNYGNGTGSNPYIINVDKIAPNTPHTAITGVTTQQLANPSYLRSIGFPCGD